MTNFPLAFAASGAIMWLKVLYRRSVNTTVGQRTFFGKGLPVVNPEIADDARMTLNLVLTPVSGETYEGCMLED